MGTLIPRTVCLIPQMVYKDAERTIEHRARRFLFRVLTLNPWYLALVPWYQNSRFLSFFLNLVLQFNPPPTTRGFDDTIVYEHRTVTACNVALYNASVARLNRFDERLYFRQESRLD